MNNDIYCKYEYKESTGKIIGYKFNSVKDLSNFLIEEEVTSQANKNKFNHWLHCEIYRYTIENNLFSFLKYIDEDIIFAYIKADTERGKAESKEARENAKFLTKFMFSFKVKGSITNTAINDFDKNLKHSIQETKQAINNQYYYLDKDFQLRNTLQKFYPFMRVYKDLSFQDKNCIIFSSIQGITDFAYNCKEQFKEYHKTAIEPQKEDTQAQANGNAPQQDNNTTIQEEATQEQAQADVVKPQQDNNSKFILLGKNNFPPKQRKYLCEHISPYLQGSQEAWNNLFSVTGIKQATQENGLQIECTTFADVVSLLKALQHYKIIRKAQRGKNAPPYYKPIEDLNIFVQNGKPIQQLQNKISQGTDIYFYIGGIEIATKKSSANVETIYKIVFEATQQK